MGPADGIGYIGGAIGYALALAGIGGAGAHLLGRPAGWRALATVAAVAFPVFLALHPFPAPGSLDCPRPWTAPQLRPFAFVDIYMRFWREDRPLQAWLSDLRIVPPVMNVVLFLPAGAAPAGLTRRWWAALAFAAGLTVSIETAQLTGLFGLYPCPYRQFDVDDLILNVAGILMGFALVRSLAGRAW